jgi:anaerobic magnesium-protoporphyrin IX monomethyl ester cyclase
VVLDLTTVTLVYPYFRPPSDKSIFRFPPLGLGYIAAYLRQRDVAVNLMDCTFLSEDEAVERVRRSNPDIIGIQSMFSMRNKSMELAKSLRRDCKLLVAGGPLPTVDPEGFLEAFDIVVVGEGEQTMFELAREADGGFDPSRTRGLAYRENGVMRLTPKREFIDNLDTIPFPARESFDNQAYKDYYLRNFGYTITPVITSRGCPFTCDFCSRPVFGNEFRFRSAANVADEMEAVRSLGYDRIWFADDCFTLNLERLTDLCDEIIRRDMGMEWECLSRVDTVDKEAVKTMKQAGCVRIFFGLESGNDSVLSLMQKHATTRQATEAVQLTKLSGIQAGAFFIVGYPGETDETILDTLRFASLLPLDYLSFTFPYPIPGTPLYDRVKGEVIPDDWEEHEHSRLTEHKLLYRSSFSEGKLTLAIIKGMIQFYLRKYLGSFGYVLIGGPFELVTDFVFRLIH